MRTIRQYRWGIVLLLLSVPAAGGPEDFLIKINGVGRAQGIGMQARQQAMADAQDKALTALAGSILGEEHPDLLRSLVEQSKAFIHTASVTDHSIDQGATRVASTFLVNLVQVRHAAVQLLLPSMAFKPRVLIVVAESLDAPDAPPQTLHAERALAEACLKAGFEIVDSTHVREAFTSTGIAQHLSHEVAARELLGCDPLADVAILGTATAARVPDETPTNLRATKAHLELRVIRADDGRMVDAAAIEAVVHSVDFLEGAAQAIRDAAGKLERQMINAAALSVVGPEATDGYALTILSPGSRDTIETLGATLGYLGAEHIEEVFYSDDVARLYFFFPGKLHEVVRPLTEARYPGFHVELLQTYGRRSVLQLHPKEL